MKVPTISEVFSFARNQMPSMPEVSWRGRTMAVLGVVTSACLLYLFRARLSQLLFGVSQTDSVKESKVEAPTVPNSITYRSFEKELISFQQFVEIHAHQLSDWLQAEESSPEWGPRLRFCKTLMLDAIGQIERIRREGCEDTAWDACKEQLVKLGSSDKGKEVCAELKNCLATLAKLDKKQMELIEQIGASQTDPVTKPKVEAPTVPNSITYRSFEKELISFQQFVEIHAHQLSDWLQAEESSPEWGPRLKFCKTLMLDVIGQITRIRQEGCEDTAWDACKEQLVKLGSSDKGKEVCAELKNCLETLAQLNELRMQLIEQKLPILNPNKKIESYQEYINFLSVAAPGYYLSDQELTKILSAKKEWNTLSKPQKEQAKIFEIQRKSFQLYFVKLRMYAGWDLMNKIKWKKPAFAELDMLYFIVKPFIREIEELAQESAESVAPMLGRMKTLLHSLLGEPTSSIDNIKQLEEYDKQRQILQMQWFKDKKRSSFVGNKKSIS